MSTLQQHVGSVPDIRTSHTAIGNGSKGDWMFLDSVSDKVIGVEEMACPNWYNGEYDQQLRWPCSCALDATRIIVFYQMLRISDQFLCARILTIDGNAITNVGPVFLVATVSTQYMECCLLDTDKVVLAYKDVTDTEKP